jgi:hypothetical protein
MRTALAATDEQLAAARRQAEKFQWRFTAESVRNALLPDRQG